MVGWGWFLIAMMRMRKCRDNLDETLSSSLSSLHSVCCDDRIPTNYSSNLCITRLNVVL